jgi:hypothetical protein
MTHKRKGQELRENKSTCMNASVIDNPIDISKCSGCSNTENVDASKEESLNEVSKTG